MSIKTKIRNPLSKTEPFILEWNYNKDIVCPKCKHQGLWAMEELKEDDLIENELLSIINESKPTYYICTVCKTAFDIKIITSTGHMGSVFKKLVAEEKKINKPPKAIRKPKIKNAVDRMEV